MNPTDLHLCDTVALAILKGTANRDMVASFVRVYTEYRKMLLGPLLPEAVYRVIRKRERYADELRNQSTRLDTDPKYKELTDAIKNNGFQLSVVNIKRPIHTHGYEVLEVTDCAPWAAFELVEPEWEHVQFAPAPEPAVEIIEPEGCRI